MTHFDYEYLGRCEYGVYSPSISGDTTDCGEAAIAKIWWNDYNKAMLVCENHFNFIAQQEEME